jgi:hypothetical protein
MKGFLCAVALLFFAALSPVRAQVSVTTNHNDNARTGQYPEETSLTPSNVNSSQFGKLFTVAVQGYIYAQPLYLANVQNIAGGTHNVLYVATEHDQLYALDADDGSVLWQLSFINPPTVNTVTSSQVSCSDLVPEIGITSTPVIDQSTGTIYLVTKTNESGSYVQRLHAIDVATQAEKFGGPVVISATVDGQIFDPLRNNQRSALLLSNGHVVIAWSSHCDNTPYHGWVMSYTAGVNPSDTITQEAVFNGSPNGGLAGVWMAGDGVAADSNGNFFFATGNGTYDGLMGEDFGDSIVQLNPPSSGTFNVADWFTPYNQQDLSDHDTDLGSGGLLLLPDLPAGSPHQHLLVQMGKEGKIHLVDRDDMGKFCSDCNSVDTNLVQEIPNATNGIWGSPAYWNGSVYWGCGADDGGPPDHLKAFSFNANGSGVLSTTPTSQSAHLFAFATAAPVISSNGTKNGIVWLVDNTKAATHQVLYAYDATNLATMLYNSGQAANSRDVPGGPVKFTAPIIANGKVYLGSQGSVSAYGLIETNTFSTSTTISSSENPSYVKQTVAYTAAVISTSGTPTGSVTFTDGKKTVATVALANGKAVYSVTYNATGPHTLVATYAGEGDYLGSVSTSLKQAVKSLPAKSTTTLKTSKSPSVLGQTITLTATVTSPLGTPPDGETITFAYGTHQLGTGTLSGGTASVSTSAVPVGTRELKAVYPGDANFATSIGYVEQTVTKH